MSAIVPPQRWQIQLPEILGSQGSGVVERVKGAASSSRRQSGRSSRRRRFARNPQKRMRTKPRGKVWSRNRRKNSSPVTVISRCLPFVRMVFPAERDLAIGEVHDPVVGDGYAMCIASQVMEDMFRPSEGSLRVDHPVLTEQRA